MPFPPRPLESCHLPFERARWHLEDGDLGDLRAVGKGIDPDDPPLPRVEFALELVRS